MEEEAMGEGNGMGGEITRNLQEQSDMMKTLSDGRGWSLNSSFPAPSPRLLHFPMVKLSSENMTPRHCLCEISLHGSGPVWFLVSLNLLPHPQSEAHNKTDVLGSSEKQNQ